MSYGSGKPGRPQPFPGLENRFRINEYRDWNPSN